MTAKKYVKDVGSLLQCRTSKKREIKRTLLLEICDAVDKGESLEDVLGHRGSAWECASHYNEHFGSEERKAIKREKRLKTWGLFLFIAVLVIVYIQKSMPVWTDIAESTVFEEAQVQASAKEIIYLYSDDAFDAIIEHMDADLCRVLDMATLQRKKVQIVRDFGPLSEIEQIQIAEVQEHGQKFAMAQAQVTYANIRVLFALTFDDEMKLVGFYVQKQ